jgi:predicted nucleic acid-binding protein
LDGQLSQMPDAERREKVELLLDASSKHVSLTTSIEGRATRFHKWNITPLDALHLAAAEAAHADYLLTTDDYLLRRAHRHADELKAKVENPARWLIQESSDEN